MVLRSRYHISSSRTSGDDAGGESPEEEADMEQVPGNPGNSADGVGVV